MDAVQGPPPCSETNLELEGITAKLPHFRLCQHLNLAQVGPVCRGPGTSEGSFSAIRRSAAAAPPLRRSPRADSIPRGRKPVQCVIIFFWPQPCRRAAAPASNPNPSFPRSPCSPVAGVNGDRDPPPPSPGGASAAGGCSLGPPLRPDAPVPVACYAPSRRARLFLGLPTWRGAALGFRSPPSPPSAARRRHAEADRGFPVGSRRSSSLRPPPPADCRADMFSGCSPTRHS